MAKSPKRRYAKGKYKVKIPVEERPIIGKQANQLKQDLTHRINEKRDELISKERDIFLNQDQTDTSLPTSGLPKGTYHLQKMISRPID